MRAGPGIGTETAFFIAADLSLIHISHFDPRQYLGDGRQFIHDVVKHKIETVLGSAGKA